jgi:hypothetical protein
MDVAPVTIAQIEKWATEKRRLYAHRFPDDRKKVRPPVQPAPPRVQTAPPPVPHLPPPSPSSAPTQ